MKLSVVIPLYNKERHVRRTLESISAQTCADFEVIVVDDGSTDNGPDLVRAHPDPRFRLISQRNAGPGAARNRGIAEAQGELLAFLDADDEWLPDYLARSVALLDHHGQQVAAVSSGYIEAPAEISREPMWRARGITAGLQRIQADTSPALIVSMLAYMSPWATVARAHVVREYGGYFERDRCVYGEDAFLWLKVLLNHTVVFNLEPLVRFHTEASELSKNLRGARPVEPFLLHPEEIRAVCPDHLRATLDRVLAIRAFKTACMLGYWGDWRAAADIRRRFAIAGGALLPRFVASAVCATPVGAGLGRAWRTLRR